MGEYYKFINKTRQEESRISLPFNFGLPYAKSLQRCSDEEVEAMFRFVIKHNEPWTEADEVIAVGDYGTIIQFAEVKQEQGFFWERYEPEKVPPLKLENFEGIEES